MRHRCKFPPWGTSSVSRPEQQRLIYSVFADQSRVEQSNKMMYIGAYGAAMIVEGAFPVVLPSLVFSACIRPIRRHESIAVSVDVPGLEQQDKSKSKPFVYELKAEKPIDSSTVQINFTPFVIAEPGTITVAMTFEDGHKETAKLEVFDRKAYTESRW